MCSIVYVHNLTVQDFNVARIFREILFMHTNLFLRHTFETCKYLQVYHFFFILLSCPFKSQASKTSKNKKIKNTSLSKKNCAF